MSRLYLTETLSEENVEARMSFLSACAERALELADDLGPGNSVAQPETGVARADAYLQSAELAFCTEQFSFGRDLLAVATRGLRDAGATLPTLARRALYLALLGETQISITSASLMIRDEGDEVLLPLNALGTSDKLAATLPLLVTAAAAASQEEMPEPEFDGPNTAAWMAAGISVEFATLGVPKPFVLYAEPAAPDLLGLEVRRAALQTLERAYERRIALLYARWLHAITSPIRAELIDWRLLTLHVAFLRRHDLGFFQDVPAVGAATRFIRDLAREFTGPEPHAQPDPGVRFI